MNRWLEFMRERGLNLNTLLLGLLFALAKFGGGELYTEVRTVHDSVIGIRGEMQMLHNQNASYDRDLVEVKTRLAAVETDIVKLQLQIKEKR